MEEKYHKGYVFPDEFYKEYTDFNSHKDFIKTAKSIYKDPPSLLPKSLIRSKIAIAGFLARDNYELKCNICHKNITINKETIIPKCNCSKFSQYIIVKIF